MTTLTPWEVRKSYYKGLELGKDVNSLVSGLNKQTKAMVASQLASANAIVVSQERLSEGLNAVARGIDAVEIGIDRVADGIAGLKAAFEWGIGEIVWQIEQNREVLQSILEVLSAPLDTQAKELRKRAERYYQNGWIEDALTEFLASEIKCRDDFAVHISLGNIYLFHKKDKVKALEYFDKAIKYAAPESAYHTSYSLLHRGVIKYSEQKPQEALACVKEAITLTPDLIEAYFQGAQYWAALGRESEMLNSLKHTILEDKYYCLKIENTEDFKPYMGSIYQLIKGLKDEIASQIQAKLSQLVANNKILCKTNRVTGQIKKLDRDCNKLENYLARDSYFDLLDARKLACELIVSQNNIGGQITNNVRSEIGLLEIEIKRENIKIKECSSYDEKDYPYELRSKIEKYHEGYKGIIVGIIAGVFGGSFGAGITGNVFAGILV